MYLIHSSEFKPFSCHGWNHYSNVIMGAIASQITGLTIVYSTVYSSADQRKHQSSTSMAFVRGIHRWPVNSPHKWPGTRKIFPFDDVIMGKIPPIYIHISANHRSAETSQSQSISKGKYKKDVTPLPTHCCYVFLVLNHRYVILLHCQSYRQQVRNARQSNRTVQRATRQYLPRRWAWMVYLRRVFLQVFMTRF